jgi:hypothetical protein
MTTAPSRRWIRYSLWTLLAGSIVLLAVLLYMIGTAHQSVMTAVRNSYAIDWVASTVIDYMEIHDDTWPSGWEDLRESYHNVAKQASDPRPPDYPWSFDELQSRVEIDWKVDPKVLATAQRKTDGRSKSFG